MAKHRLMTRRDFLVKTAATGAALALPTIITSTALGAGGRPPASERVVMGTIGFGGRASGVMPTFMREKDVQMVAVCDVKGNRRKLAKQVVDRYYDFRLVLIDLLANFYKEQLPEIVPLLIEDINGVVSGTYSLIVTD